MKLDNFFVTAPVCAVLIVAPASPASAQQVFAYPKAGQTQQQQMQDRGECNQWAVGQTGYNPSAPQPPAGGYAPPPIRLRAARGTANTPPRCQRFKGRDYDPDMMV